MQESIEDRSRQHLVAGQDLRPILDALVGRNQDATSLVAMADEAKEETRLLAIHRLESHLVDDHEESDLSLVGN